MSDVCYKSDYIVYANNYKILYYNYTNNNTNKINYKINYSTR